MIFETLNENPKITKITNFLSSGECKFLISLADGSFENSLIFADDGNKYQSTYRTSKSAILTDNGHYKKYNKHIENILSKIISVTNTDRSKIEALAVVKYLPGQEFKAHYDYFNEKYKEKLEGRQRLETIFVWLNSLNEDQGGETEFPLLNIKERPVEGSALFWQNVVNNKCQELTKHSGNKVLSGVKYGLNIWINDIDW